MPCYKPLVKSSGCFYVSFHVAFSTLLHSKSFICPAGTTSGNNFFNVKSQHHCCDFDLDQLNTFRRRELAIFYYIFCHLCFRVALVNQSVMTWLKIQILSFVFQSCTGKPMTPSVMTWFKISSYVPKFQLCFSLSVSYFSTILVQFPHVTISS